jgi:NADH dehydrogenase
MNNMANGPARIVVVGGGFAGINVVKGLRQAPAAITLVDKHNYHVFQPLLYQVATAELSPEEIAAPIRRIVRNQKNVTVAMVELIGVDLEQKLVRGRRGEKGYDYLVLATGVQPAYFGHDEYRHLAPGLKNLDDAIEIRRRILIAFEESEFEADELSRQGKLTFVVVGGGPTGVELAGAIMETATRTLPREFRNIDTTTTRVILVQGGGSLLQGMPEDMGQLAQHSLEEMGVEIRLNSRVTEVNDLGVVISNEHVPAENVFWAAGVHGMPIAESLGVELDRSGRVVVGPDLSIPGYPAAFVIGDAASAVDGNTGKQIPGVAQGAIQMGRFVAEIISQELQGSDSQKRPAFSYKDKGSMATIGRGKALASVNGRTFSGFLGWLAWGTVHLIYLVSFRNKVSVLLEWGRNYLASERSARLITGDPELKIKKVRGARMTDNQEK